MVKKYRKPIRARKKRAWWRNKTLWVAESAFALVALALYIIAFAGFFQVRSIHIEGAKLVSADALKSRIDESLSRTVGFMSTRSIFLISKADVRVRILREFPELAFLSLDRTFPNALIAVAQERAAVALWCSAFKEQCFLVDKEGIAYKELDQTELVQWRDELAAVQDSRAAERISAGTKAIDPVVLGSLLRFRDETGSIQFAGEPLSLVSFHVLSAERVHGAFSEGWEAYINPEENLSWQSTKLKAVLEKKIPAEKRKFLEYIDLRFGDQAYVKYRSRVGTLVP